MEWTHTHRFKINIHTYIYIYIYIDLKSNLFRLIIFVTRTQEKKAQKVSDLLNV